MFEGAKVAAHQTTHPRVLPKGAGVADDIAAEEPADEVLLFDTKLFRGWCVSYRKEQPEQRTTSKFEPRLTKQTTTSTWSPSKSLKVFDIALGKSKPKSSS